MPPSGADEGVRIAASLRDTHPDVGVVVLSQYAEPAYAIRLLEHGTGGRAYLLKERIRNKEQLLDAIKAVARGGSVIDPTIVDVLIEARARAAKSRLAQLTARERELLAEIAAGKSNGAIAESLVLTKRAVEKHVNSIFSKLDLPETQDVSRRVKATLIFLSEEGLDGDLTAARREALAPGCLHPRLVCPHHDSRRLKPPEYALTLRQLRGGSQSPTWVRRDRLSVQPSDRRGHIRVVIGEDTS